MEKKKGRPFGTTGAYKEIKRDKQITLRLSPIELEKLGKCAEELNKSRTNIIVEALEDFYKKMK